MAKKGNRALNYFKEVKSELKKVVWPSFKQVKNNTLVVIACVLIIGAFIWALDFGLTTLWTVVNPTPAVEQTTDNTAGKTEGTELTPEQLAELQAQYMAALEAAGVSYNEETQQFTDAETGEALTQKQVDERLIAVMGEKLPAEGETEAPAENPAQ